MVEEFSNKLLGMAVGSSDSNIVCSQANARDHCRLKPIEERWRKTKTARGTGHYSNAPDEQIITELVSALIAPRTDLNANLKLPTISPSWLNTAIGLLLSTQRYGTFRHSPSSIPMNADPVLTTIKAFLDNWCHSANPPSQSSQVDLHVPSANRTQDIHQQSMFILEQILVTFLDCHIIAHKVYACHTCKSELKINVKFPYITINADDHGLHIERELVNFFRPMASDLLCSTCGKPTFRHIEVVQWPPVLVISVHDPKATANNRKPTNVISLARFSHWLAIGMASSTLYDLVTFSSVMRSGSNSSMIRVTKVKKSWATSTNKNLIGNGEQIRRLYANARKDKHTCSIGMNHFHCRRNFSVRENCAPDHIQLHPRHR